MEESGRNIKEIEQLKQKSLLLQEHVKNGEDELSKAKEKCNKNYEKYKKAKEKYKKHKKEGKQI